MNLFIDTTNGCLILILEQDNLVVDQMIVPDQLRISDVAIEHLTKLLEKNQLTIQVIKRFYVLIGPGSYTGVRVGVSIVKTLKAINPGYEVYTLSSLHFQAETDDVISLLDAKGQKYYLGIYQGGKNLICNQLIPAEYVKDFEEQFATFKVIKDYQGFDYVKNYLALKSEFKLETDVNALEPVYIKSFI